MLNSYFSYHPIFTFSNSELEPLAISLRSEYEFAKPFPNVIIDDFLPKKVANKALSVFPGPEDELWLDWKKRDTDHQPKKLGIGHASRLESAPKYLHNIIYAFNSYPFLNFLENLTGIKNLLPDPYLNGGGIHQTISGGKLSIHTDFNHLASLGLYRENQCNSFFK